MHEGSLTIARPPGATGFFKEVDGLGARYA